MAHGVLGSFLTNAKTSRFVTRGNWRNSVFLSINTFVVVFGQTCNIDFDGKYEYIKNKLSRFMTNITISYTSQS